MNPRLRIHVLNTSAAGGLRPVTGAVPINQGDAPEGAQFVLLDENNQPIPAQTEVIARWPDGSARWVLLDFLADPLPGQKKLFSLVVGVTGPGSYYVEPFDTTVVAADGYMVTLGDSLRMVLRAVDSEGLVYRGYINSFHAEKHGPIRKTFVLSGSLVSEAGERWFSFRSWIHTYAGTRKLLVEPLILMDAETGLLQRIRELALDLQPEGGVSQIYIGGSPGFAGKPIEPIRLFQIDDSQYVIEGTDVRGSRAPGWMDAGSPGTRLAIALRDFWQQWPKSLEASSQVLSIGLLPRFKEGAFDHMTPWYKFDYLFERDYYRIRTGQARRWQVWIDLDGDGQSLAEHANAPLVPCPDPEYAVATGVWGKIAPSGALGQREYDDWSAKAFHSYIDAIDQSRDYGAMNWGDWFGERKCNWANNEYDTARQLFIHFARTGDTNAFHRGFVTARHTSEVDTIHYVNSDLRAYFLEDVCRFYTNRGITDNYPIREGMVHAHCVGHVGGFHPVEKIHQLYCELNPVTGGSPYLCLDPYNISHLFTYGMVYHYFLTGDPWVRTTLEKIGDNLASLVEDGKFPFAGRACEAREFGWPIIALCALYELDWEARYIRAAKNLVDQVLALQDPVHGGWLRRSGYGSCSCEGEKHEGEATFLSAIRINSLCRYYDLTGDARVLDPIKLEVDHMIEDRWDNDRRAWRRTACPKVDLYSTIGVVTMAVANSVRLFGDPEHRSVLQKLMANLLERNAVGKSYGPIVYGTAEAAFALAKSQQ